MEASPRKLQTHSAQVGVQRHTAGCLVQFFFNFLAALPGLWDLSSPTRDRTWVLGSESTES